MGGELMYYWLIYNTTTGAIGTHSSSHSPLVDGKIDSNLIPSGFSLLGVYDDTTKMDSAIQAAFDSPQAYLYQNGAFVANSAWPAMQLAQAKQTQIAKLESVMNATLAGGFTAKTLVGGATTPHTYPTDGTAQANFSGLVNAFSVNPNKTSTMALTLDAGWISHTKTEFYGVYSDGDAWKEAQYTQLTSLVAKVESAITVADVQAITWKEATY